MTFLWIVLGLVYVACWIYFGMATFRKGHYWMFWIGFFIPILWIIGALIAPTQRAATSGTSARGREGARARDWTANDDKQTGPGCSPAFVGSATSRPRQSRARGGSTFPQSSGSGRRKPRVLLVHYTYTQQSLALYDAMAGAFRERGCDVTQSAIELIDKRYAPRLSQFPMRNPFWGVLRMLPAQLLRRTARFTSRRRRRPADTTSFACSRRLGG